MLRYYNPWQKKDEQGNIIKPDNLPEFPFKCVGGVCPYPGVAVKNDIKGIKSDGGGNNGDGGGDAIKTDDEKKID